MIEFRIQFFDQFFKGKIFDEQALFRLPYSFIEVRPERSKL